MSLRFGVRFAAFLLATALSAACGDDKMTASSGVKGSDKPKDAGSSSSDAASDQTPPQGAADVKAWLAKAAYKDWHCEKAVHEARSPSPHGFNRICSNDAIADHVDGAADWPQGAAAVKELYTKESDSEPAAYAVYLKTDADSADGANWYWYETKAGGDIVAEGMGNDGSAKSICVACHAAAGSDAAHTPSEHGRDQVYTPVP